MIRQFCRLIVAAVALVTSSSAIAIWDAEHTSAPPHVERTARVRHSGTPLTDPTILPDGTLTTMTSYLEAITPTTTTVVSRSSIGPHSDEWWRAIAICEQGGRNDPYYGYFSIMDGSAAGLDWNAQVAMANGIVARAGDSAWAAACVTQAYEASPGG